MPINLSIKKADAELLKKVFERCSMSSSNRIICKSIIEKGRWTRELCDLCLVRDKANCPNLKLLAEQEAVKN